MQTKKGNNDHFTLPESVRMFTVEERFMRAFMDALNNGEVEVKPFSVHVQVGKMLWLGVTGSELQIRCKPRPFHSPCHKISVEAESDLCKFLRELVRRLNRAKFSDILGDVGL